MKDERFICEVYPFEEAATLAGFEVRPYTGDDAPEGAEDVKEVLHCGEPCLMGNGIFGTDIITCKKCGAQITNLESPHIAGRIWERGKYTDKAWAITKDAKAYSIGIP